MFFFFNEYLYVFNIAKDSYAGKITVSHEQMQILKEIIKKNSGNNSIRFAGNNEEENHYATLERASFFLEQEKFELDQLLLSYQNSKDEIADFLNKKVNLSAINPSGVIKFLQNMIKETKYNTFQINNLLEKGFFSILFNNYSIIKRK